VGWAGMVLMLRIVCARLVMDKATRQKSAKMCFMLSVSFKVIIIFLFFQNGNQTKIKIVLASKCTN
jgi:hypothetical protein